MSRSDEIDINAYVDGELTPGERLEVLAALQENPDFAHEACELANLKSQLQLAYASPPDPSPKAKRRRPTGLLAIAAGLLALAIGLTGGWFAGSSDIRPDRLVLLDPLGRGQAPATTESDATRIVFHLTTSDRLATSELLDDIEAMLQVHRDNGKALRVEVVSHGDGLDFLRTSLSGHKVRIHQLAESYSNLTFVACKNTIDRVEVEDGIEINVLPDAQIIESGVNHVVRRQKEGWAYIRV